MHTIKKLKILSFAKFMTLIGALIGMLFGIIYSFGGLMIDIMVSMDWLSTSETPGLSEGTLLAFGALIGMPLIGALAGCVTGLVAAPLYNRYTRHFSGSTLDFE